MATSKPQTTLFGAIELVVIGLLAALIILLAAPVVHDLVPLNQPPENSKAAPAPPK